MARRIPLTSPDAAIAALKADGGVILTGFASAAEIEEVNADSRPYLEAILKERVARHAPNAPPPESARCNLLYGRCKTAREVWLQKAPLLAIINHFLRTVSVPYNDAAGKAIETDAILSAASTLEVRPGVKAQDLHRDDFIWQWKHAKKDAKKSKGHGEKRNEQNLDRDDSQNVDDARPKIGVQRVERDGQEEQFEDGQEISMGLLVPGVDTSVENGATLYVPKSHIWDHSRTPVPEEVRSAEMHVGEAFLFLGSTVHGGGRNTTKTSRPVHGFFFCRSWLRPEENMHLYFTKEEVSQWSPAAQQLAGYQFGTHFLGHCNEKNPIELFRASTRNDENGALAL